MQSGNNLIKAFDPMEVGKKLEQFSFCTCYITNTFLDALHYQKIPPTFENITVIIDWDELVPENKITMVFVEIVDVIFYFSIALKTSYYTIKINRTIYWKDELLEEQST